MDTPTTVDVCVVLDARDERIEREVPIRAYFRPTREGTYSKKGISNDGFTRAPQIHIMLSLPEYFV